MKPHFFIAVLFSLPLYASDPIIIADFEGSDYRPWVSSGDAFGAGPAPGTLPGQMNVDGFIGKGLVNSFLGGDASTGVLTSPRFKIERRFITFLIGGGKDIEKTCMILLIDDKIVRAATGPNDRPGGTERLLPEAWDVGEYIGRSAVIQIVDRATGGWGHINVDHIIQTDQKPAGSIANATREIQIAKRYLHLPIKNGATKRKVTMLVDGQVQVVNDIELADSEPDWWAFVDVSHWKGKTMTLAVDQLSEDSLALQSIEQGDTVKDAEGLYGEPLRGQFHFSSQRGWNNDPNGLVYYNGEYHLFYQHNPYGWGWGNMHWGHAVSPDLVHWRELGDALAPDKFGPMFSGSAVVDWNNTSGLGKDGTAPLVLLYTAAGNPTVQCLAWSLDGRHFTKYSGNPVLPEITPGNRDPKVIWHEPTGKWVMVLYVTMPEKKHTVHFLTSANLRDWTPASITEGGIDADKFLYECPDFFPLPVDGDATKVQWVLSGADSNYAIGDFDGTTFTPRYTRLPGHLGKGFYAAQTFSDIPASDGRRVQIGWFQTPTVGMPFNQSMSLPLELRLTATQQGPRLTMNPVKELEALRSRSHRLGDIEIGPGGDNPLADLHPELVELDVRFEPGATTHVEFKVRGALIRYDAAAQRLSVNGHQVPAPLRGKAQRVQIFCDRTGLEVFAGDGLTYVPMPFQPKPEERDLSVRVHGAPARFQSLDIHELRSAWE